MRIHGETTISQKERRGGKGTVNLLGRWVKHTPVVVWGQKEWVYMLATGNLKEEGQWRGGITYLTIARGARIPAAPDEEFLPSKASSLTKAYY